MSSNASRLRTSIIVAFSLYGGLVLFDLAQSQQQRLLKLILQSRFVPWFIATTRKSEEIASTLSSILDIATPTTTASRNSSSASTIAATTKTTTATTVSTTKTTTATTGTTTATTSTSASTIATQQSPHSFYRHESVRHLDCARLLVDAAYANASGQSRVKLSQEIQNSLPTDCKSIQRRHNFSRKITPTERDYPLAFVRVAYLDYLVNEMQVAALYTPQNQFCFIIDNKVSPDFRSQMRNLSSCFPENVHILPIEFRITSNGDNLTRSMIECVKYLLKPDIKHQWQYVALLHNDDILLKTNRELVDIFTVLNGTNDVETEPLNGPKAKPNIDWRINAMNLYPGKDFGNQTMRFANGFGEVSLSRAFAIFITQTLNLTKYIDAIDGPYASDEMFFPSVNSDERLDAPGSFTRHCLDNHTPGIWVHHFTRETIWSWELSPTRPCHSGYFRHGICTFGIEDVAQLQRFPHFFANKMRADFDFGAISCQMESIYNRTHFNIKPIALDFYKSYPGLRYRQFREKYGPTANMSLFNCTSQWPFPLL